MRLRASDDGNRGWRPRNLLIIAALLAIALSGASGVASRIQQEEPGPTAIPQVGGVYVEAMVGNPNAINPLLLQFNQTERDLSALLFTGLTKFDDNGLLVPDLAERWEIADGGKSYTFYLRRDVRWHDRTPFTADDVVFSIKAMQAPDFQGSPEVADLWRGVGVEELDDYTIRFTLKEPFAPFLEYTTAGILPRHLYSESTGKAMLTSPYNFRPVGTGPFKLTRISSEGIVLEPFADYYGPAPRLSQMRFRFYPDYASALAALEKGEVDGLPYLEPQDAVRLMASDRLTVYSAPDYQKYVILLLNNSSPVFKEQAVRQAVAYAINKDRIVATAMDGQAIPGKGPISPGSWAFNPKAKTYAYDPKKAESILEDAGWRDTNGDGIRDKNGVSLSFVILTNDNRRRIRAAELVAEDVRKIGFKVEVQAPAWADLLKEYLAPRTYLGALTEQWLLTADPDVQSLWSSKQIGNGGFNFSGMANDRADQLLEEATRTVDTVRRTQLYSEFQDIWAEEIPSIILYYPMFNWGVSRNVQGVRLTVLVDGSSRFRHVSEWYVRAGGAAQTGTPASR